MTDSNVGRYSDEELHAAFDLLFPFGLSGQDVLRELAPDGWERSPLSLAFHPTVDQLFAEALRMHESIVSWRRPEDRSPVPQPPTREKIAREHRPREFESVLELGELIGKCLWAIFSDNHEVLSLNGRPLDLGTWRGSGGFLAEILNRETGTDRYDYMNFYMGAVHIESRADLTPVYRLIFRRLRARGFDWVYCFPQMYMWDPRSLPEATSDSDQPDWEPGNWRNPQISRDLRKCLEAYEAGEPYREDPKTQ